MKGSLLNKGKASLRRVEHPKMSGEAQNNSSTDSQVAKCVRTEVMNPKLLNVQ
jgi:hypothetical protein